MIRAALVAFALMLAGAAEARVLDTGELLERCRDLVEEERGSQRILAGYTERKDRWDRIVAQDLTLRSIDREVERIVCRWLPGPRRLVLISPQEAAADFRDEGDAFRPPSERESLRGCQDRAWDRGFMVRRIRVVDLIRDDRDRPIGREVSIEAARDGDDWLLLCDHDFRDGDFDLSVRRR
jgi:hypothetical protein